MKELNISGYKEQIIERSDYPIEKCKEIQIKRLQLSLVMAPRKRTELNMRDQGFNVIVGLRRGQAE